MSSVRMWLVSGTFAAGVGAGLLCGAGVASADTGGDPGTARSAAHESAQPARAQRGGARTVGATPAAAVRVSAAKPANKTPASASAVSAPAPAASAPKSAAAAPQPAATQPVVAKSVAPSSVPVDPAKYAGTYYEQGSVKQFFSIGLVNTKATYTLNPDGTIKVQNSGNYFFNRGPRSSITGSAVAVNANNTALNVGFFSPRPPAATPPGNYTILETAPDYSWAIVSDPSGQSGYILTRDKNISPEEYKRLTDRARELGVKGRITPTRQF
jgi:lipocalin